MPPDALEYTEYHENVLQSYRHKQLNTQLLEYIEVPGEAIWWHRMQVCVCVCVCVCVRVCVCVCVSQKTLRQYNVCLFSI